MARIASRGPWRLRPGDVDVWEDADGRRVGNQRPRLFFGPDAVAAPTSAVEDMRVLARDFGRPMYEWQDWFATEALRELPDGLWAAMTVVLVVPRQNGKTLLVLLRILTGLFLWDEKLIVYSAHQFTTTLETFGALVSLLDRSKKDHVDYSRSIEKWVKAVGGYRVINTNGHESVIFGNGARVKFVARTKGKGRGFTGDCVIFDEAGFRIDPEITDALIPSMSAVLNPQVWYLSSSGTLASNVLLDLRQKSLTGKEDAICYAEWSIPQKFDDPDTPEPDVTNMEYAYYSNPLLNIRISTRYLEKVELPNLTRDGYLRERLGVWAEPEETDRPINLVAWAQCEDPTRAMDKVAAAAIDVSLGRDRATLVTVGPAGGPNLAVHVEAVGSLAQIEQEAVRLFASSMYDDFCIVVPSYGPAAAVGVRLRSAGVRVADMPSGKASLACSGFADHITAKDVLHYGQEPLDNAVQAAVKQMSGANWTFDRRKPGDDISPLWAAAAGVWFLDDMDAETDDTITEDNAGVGP